jgi:mannose-6-phosphate isomerase
VSARATTAAQVVELAVNTPQRFYRGGERILAFRGLSTPEDFDGRRPEDWLASTTRLFAEGGDGLSSLPDGRLLADVLVEEPEPWLGPDHLARHGAEPGLLVKLLDAAERLPVHSHPDRGFAARHLGCAHGKTEAWLVVDAAPGAMVWLGFEHELADGQLVAAVDAQDDGLLGLLNGFEVSRGDAILVPAGQPHAIGSGVMVVELQEPTDFSVMLEHARFGLDPQHAWLGLDRVQALDSVTSRPLSPGDLAALRSRWEPHDAGLAAALPDVAAEYFCAEVVDAHAEPVPLDARFSVLVVVDGAGRLTGRGGATRALVAGQVLLTPYAAGPLEVEGPVTVLRCSPSRDPSGAAPHPTPPDPEGEIRP